MVRVFTYIEFIKVVGGRNLMHQFFLSPIRAIRLIRFAVAKLKAKTGGEKTLNIDNHQIIPMNHFVIGFFTQAGFDLVGL